MGKINLPLDKTANVNRAVVEDGMGLSESIGTRTRVRIFDSKSKKILYEGHNTTVLGGRLSLLERAFGITPEVSQHLTLNQMLGIEHSETSKVLSNSLDRSVCYFMAGKGAASTTVPGKVYSPKNYETKLYDPIPFRLVPTSNDLSATEQEQYRLKKLMTFGGTEYYGYFAKKFDPGSVVVEYNDAEYLPQESHTVPVDENDSTHPLSGGSVLAYVQFTLTIAEEELKEYFKVVNGSLSGASMSEIGLVLGADLANSLDSGRKELAAAETFAKVVSSAVAMDSETSARVVEYRVYAR